MTDCCCNPLGPGTPPPGPAFYQTVENDGAALPQQPVLNVVNGTLANDPGNTSTDLTLQYQSVMTSDGTFLPKQLNLEFQDADFIVSDDGAVDATRARLRNPLPSPSTNQDRLGVAGGAWAAVANGFLSFATTALRDAFPGLRTAGMVAYVTTTQCLYMLAPDLTTWNFFTSSPALAAQTAWAVDAGVAGDDNNSGLPGSPLKTVEELSRRLCPNGQRMTFAVGNTAPTITLAAGSYGSLALNIGWPAGTTTFGSVLTIVGAVTSSGAITLSNVIAENAGTNTSAELVTLAGAFVDHALIRQTSGAQTGSYTYSAGLNGPATDTFTGAWLNFNNNSTAGPAIGNTVVVDTLGVTLDVWEIQCWGKGYVVLQTVKCGNAFVFSDGTTSAFNGAGPYLLGCELNNGGYFSSVGGLGFWSCRVPPAASVTLSGNHFAFNGCAIQGSVFTENQCNITMGSPNILDGGRFLLNSDNVGGRTSVQSAGNIQHVRGTGLTAWTMTSPGCQIFSGTVWWGTRTPYATGISTQSGCWIYASGGIANYKLTTTTTLFSVSGHNLAVGGTPIGYPRANCGVSVTPDAAAVGITT